MVSRGVYGAIALFSQKGAEHAHDEHHAQELIRHVAKKRGWEILGFFAVDDSSIAKGIAHIQSVLSDRECSLLIVDDATTLSLNPPKFLKFFEFLMKNSIDLVFARSNLIVKKDYQKEFATMMAQSARAQSRSRSRAIKDSLEQKRRAGRPLGAPQFGRTKTEKKILQQILKMHSDGLSLQKICDVLVLNDVKTVQKKTWHPTTIKRILERHKK